ncbi:hypothetical protein IMG5_003430 [Ichthyophthirius multifiliis]|uniref:Uncharacterized protein n=1 Tax=Ichthyophthirius multifiliis TaxID=5932 RepID=G0QJA1_ICHMU|nr:hypothetical protein IMG5_003430 [Ichthyophthirius multifiliis]EGR34710.1 hypothetical protein IMG5_003430 [Ichthyophthirius multifiliis]|eukprot:XP_004040014.1 hypothetical protein IMG5_003430 [Ichthyophthirius multifiliis]
MENIFQKNNLDIIKGLIEQTDTHLEFSTFYHDLVCSIDECEGGFTQPLILFDHFESFLDFIDAKYNDLFGICIKLLNILMENNETLFPQKNIDMLQAIFPDITNSQLTLETFQFLEELYQDSEYFIDLQTEIFRFFNLHFLKAKNVIFNFEKRYFELNLLIGNELKVAQLTKKIFALKSNIQLLEKLLRQNIQGFVSKVRLFQKMLKKSSNFLKDYGLHAIFLPFENIISFTKLVGDANFLNGLELMKIKELVIEFIFIRDLFTTVMLSPQIPRKLDQFQSNALLEKAKSIPEGKLFGKIEDIFEKYEKQLANKEYTQIYNPVNINNNYYQFYKRLINEIDFLSQKDQASELIMNSPLYQLHYQQTKLKNFCKISNIFLNYFLKQTLKPNLIYPFNKQKTSDYYSYNNMCNNIKLLNRLLIFDTKLFQNLIREYIEESVQNKELFVSILQKVSYNMPLLFSLVKNYETNFEDNTLRRIGDLCVEFLQFFRYLAEEQHEYLQNIIGEQGILLKMIGLSELLFKSWQIDILTNKSFIQNQIMEGGITQTFVKLFTYSMINLAEMHLGPCTLNQIQTVNLFTQQKIWPIIIKLLVNKTSKYTSTQETIRVYVLELIISLLEGQNSDILESINSFVNYKILEETFIQTFKSIVKTYLKMDIHESSSSIVNLYHIQELLIQMYKNQLGENLHQSVLQEKNLPIKIIVSILKILNIYKTISKEVETYLNFYKKRKTDKQNYKSTYNGIITTGFKFLDGIIAEIELVNNQNKLQTYQYILPPQCFYLSHETKIQFMEQVDRSNNGAKLGCMIEKLEDFIIEMEENKYIYQKYQTYLTSLLNFTMFSYDHSNPVFLYLYQSF